MKLEGYVEHIIYRNTENGYSVLNLVSDGEELTAVGIFHYISEGELLELEGEYTEHPLYGQQFHAERFEIKTPKDALAMERYLGKRSHQRNRRRIGGSYCAALRFQDL